MDVSIMVDAMVNAGCSPEQIAAVVKACVADQEAREEAARAAKKEKFFGQLGVTLKEWYALRWAVFERDGMICAYCGIVADLEGPAHCDHVIPRSRGGQTALDNLATACLRCNSSKRDKTPSEWRGRQ